MIRSMKHLRAIAVATMLGTGAIMSSADAAPILQQISPNPTTYTLGADWTLFAGTYPNAEVIAPLAALSGASVGCAAGDFAGFAAGSIALIERGTCTFSDKVANAEAAGAVGAIIYNHSVLWPISVTAGTVGIMPVFTTQALGLELLALLEQQSAVMRIDLRNVPEPGPLALIGIGLIGLALMRRRRAAPSELCGP